MDLAMLLDDAKIKSEKWKIFFVADDEEQI